MSTVTVGQENSTAIDLYYEDHGSGKPVILVHGWPLSGAFWEKQVTDLLNAGHRVITYDRRAFLSQFLLDFFNVDVFRGKLVTDQVVQLSWNIAAGASPRGTVDCVTAFSSTDFRNDLGRIDVPTLVIHGDADRIVPFAVAGNRMPDFVKDCKLIKLEGAPHGLNWTHANKVNPELVHFLG